MILRPYQAECCKAVLQSIDEGARGVLYVMATGTGKTAIASTILAERSGKGRSLVLADRKELLDQARAQLREIAPHLSIDLERAEHRADTMGLLLSDIVVSTMQTQIAGRNGYRRMERWNPNHFQTLWLDEAHTAVNRRTRRTIEYYQANNAMRLIGCTATPNRHDKKALGQIFDNVAYEYGLLEAINDGWLVQPIEQFVETDVDFSGLSAPGGDFTAADVSRLINNEKTLHGFALALKEKAPGLKTLVFCPGVADAQALTEIINRYDPGDAECVFGHTPEEERDRIIGGFRTNAFRVLVNVGVLTHGFDVPDIQCIAIARTTKSYPLYMQMLGRGTRAIAPIDNYDTIEGRKGIIASSTKPYLTVIDLVGNSGRHKIMSCVDALGGRYDQDVIDLAVRTMRQSGKPENVLDALEQAAREKRKRDEETAIQARSWVKATSWQTRTKHIDPFTVYDLTPQRSYTGFDVPASDAQVQLLTRMKVDMPNALTKRSASQLIGLAIQRRKAGLATYKQLKWLKTYRVPNAERLSFKEASAALDICFGRKRR